METVQVALTPHECDLVARVLQYAAMRCAERLRHETDIEAVALTWLRDEVEVLLPKFREHIAP